MSKKVEEKKQFDAETITKIVTERKKCGLVIANSASVPAWMTNDELPANVIKKRQKPLIFQQSPLKGTFSDGFAMYSTFSDVENCDVTFGVNVSGPELMESLYKMFHKTTEGVVDFFLYYSGIGKNFNGDWMGYDEENDTLNIITLNSIIKQWKSRPYKNKNQYLLIITDTNYSGIWVSKAKDKKLFSKENVLIQSSVGRDENSLEMTIGEIKPPCWIQQITCGKFTHCWLDVCSSPFYKKHKNVIYDMYGSFVVLNKKIIWDSNEEYHDKNTPDHPMSNILTKYDEQTMIIIPAFGYTEKHLIGLSTDLDNVLLQINNMPDDDDDDDNKNDEIEKKKQKQKEAEINKNVKFIGLKPGSNKLSAKRRSSHLPQPSVRRLNLLQGVIGGLKLKKHKKQKSRHVSTYGREFIFTKVLSDIRHLVMGSDDDNDDNNAENDADWIND